MGNHWGITNDELTRKENLEKGHELCKTCEGTGNQLYSMYQKCIDCDGTGIKRNK